MDASRSAIHTNFDDPAELIWSSDSSWISELPLNICNNSELSPHGSFANDNFQIAAIQNNDKKQLLNSLIILCTFRADSGFYIFSLRVIFLLLFLYKWCFVCWYHDEQEPNCMWPCRIDLFCWSVVNLVTLKSSQQSPLT